MEMQRCVAALACYKLYKPLTRPSPPNYRPGNEGCSSNTNLTSFDTKMATLSYCVCLLMGWILTKCGHGIVQQVGPNNGRLSPDKLCPPISPQHQLQVRLSLTGYQSLYPYRAEATLNPVILIFLAAMSFEDLKMIGFIHCYVTSLSH